MPHGVVASREFLVGFKFKSEYSVELTMLSGAADVVVVVEDEADRLDGKTYLQMEDETVCLRSRSNLIERWFVAIKFLFKLEKKKKLAQISWFMAISKLLLLSF